MFSFAPAGGHGTGQREQSGQRGGRKLDLLLFYTGDPHMPDAPGRKLVRVVVLDLDPQFAAGPCFLPPAMCGRGPMTSRAKEGF